MRRGFLFALLLVLFFGSAALADPVQITSGRVTFTDEPGMPSVGGSDFALDIGWFPRVVSGTFWWNRCGFPGCTSGTVVDFGTTTYAFSDFRVPGSGRVDGTAYGRHYIDGELTFAGPSPSRH